MLLCTYVDEATTLRHESTCSDKTYDELILFVTTGSVNYITTDNTSRMICVKAPELHIFIQNNLLRPQYINNYFTLTSMTK